jgi:hypothetical protein
MTKGNIHQHYLKIILWYEIGTGIRFFVAFNNWHVFSLLFIDKYIVSVLVSMYFRDT